jgi:hypothetical protein
MMMIHTKYTKTLFTTQFRLFKRYNLLTLKMEQLYYSPLNSNGVRICGSYLPNFTYQERRKKDSN